MVRRTLVSAAVLGGLALMAIGSGGTGLPSADPEANKAACKTYWNHYNTLECLPGGIEMDAAELCDSINNPYVDMTPYYECLAEKVTCVDGTINTDEQSSCNDKLNPAL